MINRIIICLFIIALIAVFGFTWVKYDEQVRQDIMGTIDDAFEHPLTLDNYEIKYDRLGNEYFEDQDGNVWKVNV